jgi:hypothetical protein
MSRARWSPSLHPTQSSEVIAHGTSPLYDAPDPGNLEPELLRLFTDDSAPGELVDEDEEAISAWFDGLVQPD